MEVIKNDKENFFAKRVMKAAYEHVQIDAGHSARVFCCELPYIPFEWHHHAEFLLTLTLNTQGRRYIGDAIDDYQGPDLVLVPPDLTHTWIPNTSLDTNEPQRAIVIWFVGTWIRRLADCFVELEAPLRSAIA